MSSLKRVPFEDSDAAYSGFSSENDGLLSARSARSDSGESLTDILWYFDSILIVSIETDV